MSGEGFRNRVWKRFAHGPAWDAELSVPWSDPSKRQLEFGHVSLVHVVMAD